MPSCGRCGGVNGELIHNKKKADKGQRIQLQYDEEINRHYCSIRCQNIIKGAIKQQQREATRRQKKYKMMKEKQLTELQNGRRIYACQLAYDLPVSSQNFHGKFSSILALVNHWKNEENKKRDDGKVFMKLGDIETTFRIFPNKKEELKLAPPSPGTTTHFGEVPITSTNRTIWRTRTVTKLPTVEVLQDFSMSRGIIDLQDFEDIEFIRVMIPKNVDEKNFDPPVYDEPETIEPNGCPYHWATCYNDSCEIHKDQKIVNNYWHKEKQFQIPKPSHDHPEVDRKEAQRCHNEEINFRNTSEMTVNYQPEEDPVWATYGEKCEEARRMARKNRLSAGPLFCYLRLFAQESWNYISAVLGPNPKVLHPIGSVRRLIYPTHGIQGRSLKVDHLALAIDH